MTSLFIRFREFLQLFFPETCEVCGNSLRYGEHLLCTDCLSDIPQIYLHNLEHNPVEKIFWGQVPFARATAFFNYQKHTNYAHLIHKLKYQGRDDIGILLGEMFGVKLQESGFLDDIDAIVPIPLHPKRQRKRGYNQSQMIAEGISNITKTPIITDAVIRKIYTNTQTRKNKDERAKNVQGIFEVTDNKALENKHILIIDDVITTGATCISCAETILKQSNVKAVSFASVALAN
ncbi:MAG: ComF family protein [Bacteroidales bacterium]|nr:ComF family protein [Bacteroidales bacterium]